MFALNNIEWTLVVAIIVFVAAALLYVTSNQPNHGNFARYGTTLAYIGLAIFAFAFIINP